jgi:prepilin-type N-terminal cleavage/methylation domain-containing protein
MNENRQEFFKEAFTLAEVLITLAIIGVVAALTIPTVVQNYRKTQAVAQLKKTYSALANTTNLAIANYGPITGWEIGENHSGQAAIDFANKYLIPYLKVAKNCETETTGDCAFKWAVLDKSKSGSFGSEFTRFYLTDGTLIAVLIVDDSTSKRASIYIDLNGRKPPDTYGKDIFYYNYFITHSSSKVAGRFMPEWYTADRDFLKANCSMDGGTDSGKNCTSLIMKDSWQMKDDYPW